MLRDDGFRYAARLREAGVPVRFENYLGMPHGFLSLASLCPAAPVCIVRRHDNRFYGMRGPISQLCF